MNSKVLCVSASYTQESMQVHFYSVCTCYVFALINVFVGLEQCFVHTWSILTSLHGLSTSVCSGCDSCIH